MSAERSPARPWFDLVGEQIAIRGWGVAELARRAKIGRPTVYGWRDNPNKPQPGPVNAVADILGIPRERALRLAGIIATPSADPELPTPAELQRLKDHIREVLGDRAAATEAEIDKAMARDAPARRSEAS